MNPCACFLPASLIRPALTLMRRGMLGQHRRDIGKESSVIPGNVLRENKITIILILYFGFFRLFGFVRRIRPIQTVNIRGSSNVDGVGPRPPRFSVIPVPLFLAFSALLHSNGSDAFQMLFLFFPFYFLFFCPFSFC